ncbi:MAG: hypothetical protein JW913_13365 [Chitinispirillaceae bacterium]|nr:hypothetical protein [Chitinispirillaceae bacterium]
MKAISTIGGIGQLPARLIIAQALPWSYEIEAGKRRDATAFRMDRIFYAACAGHFMFSCFFQGG